MAEREGSGGSHGWRESAREAAQRFREVRLDRLAVAQHVRIDPIASGLKLDSLEVTEDFIRRQLVVRLHGYVLAEKLPPARITRSHEVEFLSPATWWDHWKADHFRSWFGAWIASRWPPKLRSEARTVTLAVDLTPYRTFPEATWEHPQSGPAVMVVLVAERVRVEP